MSCEVSNCEHPSSASVRRSGTSSGRTWASAAWRERRLYARGTVVHCDSVPAGSDNGDPARVKGEGGHRPMATTAETSAAELQELAKRHLWMHFSRMGAYADGAEVPIIVRGDGCYVWDQHGKRYLDGLSSLFCTNIGHGRADVAQAGADQSKELGFFTNWSYAHPRAIELAAKVAELAPGDLNRVFFTSGGSEAVESAL